MIGFVDAVTAAPAAEQSAAGAGVGGESIVTMALSLVTVLVIIFLLAWLMKRFQPMARSTHGLRMKGALGLGQKERIIAVEAGSQILIIGVTANQISLLKEISKEEWQATAAEGQETLAPSFKSLLGRYQRGHHSGEQQ